MVPRGGIELSSMLLNYRRFWNDVFLVYPLMYPALNSHAHSPLCPTGNGPSFLIEGLAEASIAVITLPADNLFLQGRDAPSLPPRGLAPVRQLRAVGVRAAAASDNIQDPFIPIGSGDLLEVARWTLLTGHFGLADHRVAFDMVASEPASTSDSARTGASMRARAPIC
jgi:cytosine/adenosine deaminase-related metal-dependent hydrolase